MTLPRARQQHDEENGASSDSRGDRNVVSLLTEMFMLPFTAFLYGMELLVRAMQGTQSVTERSMHVITAGSSEQRVTSGNDGSPEPRPAQKEAATMDSTIGYESRRDRDLRDDTLKLVRYKILFVKRDYEVAFPEQEDLVYDNMDASAFAAWKVAEFVQHLHRDGERLPPRWRDRKYPGERDDRGEYMYISSDFKRLKGLPEEDKKYLRVYYEVLDRYPREKFRHDEKQIRVLEEIRDVLDKEKGRGGSDSSSSDSSEGGASGAGGGGSWEVR